jgi:hypothetical protein
VHAVALNEDLVVEYGQALSFVRIGILRESGAKDSFGVLPQQGRPTNLASSHLDHVSEVNLTILIISP